MFSVKQVSVEVICKLIHLNSYLTLSDYYKVSTTSFPDEVEFSIWLNKVPFTSEVRIYV